MAGPAACVLVSFAGQRYLPNWRDILSPFASSWQESDFCHVSDTKQFGGSYQGLPRPFCGRIEDRSESWCSVAEKEAHAAITGREFTHSIEIAAGCNDHADHRILCELCIAVADSQDGVVDFGPVAAPLEELGLLRFTWIDIDGEYSRVLGTVAASRRWLAHKRFYMVK